MATEAPLLTLTFKAGEDITKNRFVTVNTGTIFETLAGEVIVGVSRNDASIDERVGVHTLGTALVEASGAISASELVSADNDGKAIQYNKAAPTPVAGYALNSTSSAGELVEVLLNPDTK